MINLLRRWGNDTPCHLYRWLRLGGNRRQRRRFRLQRLAERKVEMYRPFDHAIGNAIGAAGQRLE